MLWAADEASLGKGAAGTVFKEPEVVSPDMHEKVAKQIKSVSARMHAMLTLVARVFVGSYRLVHLH
jgi:hypothetical protein